VIAEQRALSEAFERFGATCVASRALLECVWRGVASPVADKIGFFVELLEHCGLVCELEKDEFFVPAASKATPSAGLVLDWTNGAEQIALVCADKQISALPPSLLPRIVASLFKSGAIMPPTSECVVTQRDVVLLLRASVGASVRRMRLQQSGNRVVLTLQRRASDDEAAARVWRLRAYTALYAAVESVLRLVFGSLALTAKASVLCAKCNVWLAADICSSATHRPRQHRRVAAARRRLAQVCAAAQRLVDRGAVDDHGDGGDDARRLLLGVAAAQDASEEGRVARARLGGRVQRAQGQDCVDRQPARHAPV
jgi:hypothetical protein